MTSIFYDGMLLSEDAEDPAKFFGPVRHAVDPKMMKWLLSDIGTKQPHCQPFGTNGTQEIHLGGNRYRLPVAGVTKRSLVERKI